MKVARFVLKIVALSLAAGGGKPAPSQSSGSTPPAASNPPAQSTPAPSGSATELTLWTYPVGGWGTEANVQPIMDAFKADTGITVKVEYLAYADGDDKVNSAITAKAAPDLIMEGPERLVANWGAKGYMVDMSDILTDTDRSELAPAALAACTTADGKFYEYPLCMTAHCMAINLDAFKQAGADQYLDLETRTWTTENFFKAVDALYAEYNDTVGAVFCKGQGGDQGTRALINNLYGGTFTDAAHTKYTWDDPNNIKALEALKAKAGKGLAFDPALEGGDELKLLYQDIFKMAFCWNIAQQLNPNQANTGAGLTMGGDEIVCMNFPTESGAPVLQGGIWGLGIFNNGDEAKIEAAKEFVKWMCASENAAQGIKVSNFFPARNTVNGTDLTTIFDGSADGDIMKEYNKVILPNLGDYYQVTAGWAAARTEWWNMLQEINNGTDIATAVATHTANANAAMAG